jgi:hypothetical protein
MRLMADASPPVLFEDIARFVLLALLTIDVRPRPFLENLAIWAVLSASFSPMVNASPRTENGLRAQNIPL